ncbi:peptide ABC transporter permease [Carnobacterium iners]|uniref:peptide ABC transporter permease n=1 Tax=Carnobacterium iners TaxID=1073423 RepID=UPI0008D30F80|nr:peptide ABC transporter permease [Carnobacterium iners]SEL22253.1 peptide/nickel transport system permease protein [Carnobacterium iners]
MSKQKYRNRTLWVLCSILLSFLLLSFLYEPLLSKFFIIRVDKAIINGELAYPPFSPLEVRPFGTDILGFTILAKVIQGFKYTFFIGLFLSVFQILISLFLSTLTIYKLGKTLLMPIVSYFDKLFALIPKPFLLLLLIGPYYHTLLFSADNVQPAVNLTFLLIQLLILFLVGLPSLVKLYHDELTYLLKQDFADASQSLGRSKFRLVRYSFKPQLKELTLNLLVKILTQNLSLFIYLAYFKLYLEGSLVMKLDVSTQYTVTLSNE